jgi:hypothetical protein
MFTAAYWAFFLHNLIISLDNIIVFIPAFRAFALIAGTRVRRAGALAMSVMPTSLACVSDVSFM